MAKTHYRPFVTHRLEGYHKVPPQTLVSIEDKSVSRRRGDSFKTERAAECFQAYDSVGGELFSGFGPVKLNLDVEDLNTDSTLFALSNDEITVKVSGVYLVVYHVGGESGTVNRVATATLRVNSTDVTGTESSFTTTGVSSEDFNLNGSANLRLKIDDVVTIQISAAGTTGRPKTIANQSSISIIGPIRP